MDRCTRCGDSSAAPGKACPACGFNPATASQDTGALDLNLTATGTEEQPLPADVSALVVTNGPAAGERYLLMGEIGARVSVGRTAETDIFLDDVTVSRHHGTFTRAATQPTTAVWEYTDNASLNGTYLNGRRIDKATLSDGDILMIGKFKFAFVSASGA